MHETSETICGHCRYFRSVDAQSGACHRFPPVFAGDASPREMHRWRFPLVSLHAWCGEFMPAAAGASAPLPPPAGNAPGSM